MKFFSQFRHAKNGTDCVDFSFLKIPEWYFLECNVVEAIYTSKILIVFVLNSVS